MLTLGELAHAIGAVLEGGDAKKAVRGAHNLAEAGPDELAPLTDPRYAPMLAKTRAGAVVLKRGEHPAPPADTALLYAEDAELAFLKALNALYPETRETPGVDARAGVEPGAALGRGVYVGPFAVVRAGSRIGEGSEIHAGAYVGRGCVMGAHCRIMPRAVLYDGVELGDECIVHSGAVVGADGFGYKFRGGRHVKVPQVGTVKLGHRVEIGANTCIDRAALGATLVGEGSKIDNLVQVGHNCKLGQHVILCGQAGVAGSVNIHDYAMLGANSGIADHLTIGMAAKVGAKSGVTRDLEPKEEVWGLPAEERRAFWRMQASFRKLPELVKRVRELEQRLEKE